MASSIAFALCRNQRPRRTFSVDPRPNCGSSVATIFDDFSQDCDVVAQLKPIREGVAPTLLRERPAGLVRLSALVVCQLGHQPLQPPSPRLDAPQLLPAGCQIVAEDLVKPRRVVVPREVVEPPCQAPRLELREVQRDQRSKNRDLGKIKPLRVEISGPGEFPVDQGPIATVIVQGLLW